MNHLTDQQRRYYHGYVLTVIAQRASVGGKRYPLHVWKEHYRNEFLGFKTKTEIDPMTGKKHRRRVRHFQLQHHARTDGGRGLIVHQARHAYQRAPLRSSLQRGLGGDAVLNVTEVVTDGGDTCAFDQVIFGDPRLLAIQTLVEEQGSVKHGE